MKNKHPHADVVLVLGLAMAGLHLADLLLWSEADTGFAAAGSVWLRYIPVSYTHLDVYKRQMPEFGSIVQKG